MALKPCTWKLYFSWENLELQNIIYHNPEDLIASEDMKEYMFGLRLLGLTIISTLMCNFKMRKLRCFRSRKTINQNDQGLFFRSYNRAPVLGRLKLAL